MSFDKNAGGPGEGIFPGLNRVRVRFTEAAAQYGHKMFDLASTVTTLSTDAGGDPGTSCLNTVRDPDASSGSVRTLQAFFFGVAEEAQAAGSDGWVVIRGETEALVASATAAGSCLIASVATDEQLDVADTMTPTTAKIIGISKEADTSNQASIWFNGIEGFGHDG